MGIGAPPLIRRFLQSAVVLLEGTEQYIDISETLYQDIVTDDRRLCDREGRQAYKRYVS